MWGSHPQETREQLSGQAAVGRQPSGRGWAGLGDGVPWRGRSRQRCCPGTGKAGASPKSRADGTGRLAKGAATTREGDLATV